MSLLRWLRRQLRQPTPQREHLEAAIANDDPGEVRRLVEHAPFTDAQRRHVEGLIDRWEDSTCRRLTTNGSSGGSSSAFARKEGLALRGLFDDDAVWSVPGRGIMAGTYRGREAIFQLPHQAAEGDRGDVPLGADRRSSRARLAPRRSHRAHGTRHERGPELEQVLLFRIEDGLSPRRAGAPRATRTPSRRSGRKAVLAVSDARFSDGLRYRIEIPSVEGPRVLEAVLDEAERRSVPVRRVSQGSGVMMLTDAEIRDLARLGADAGVEVSLFLGPRGAWDVGGQSLVTAAAGGVARGAAGIDASVAEVRRGVALGIRSFLVADLGVLKELGDLQTAGRASVVPRPQDVRATPLRESRDGTDARGARRDDDQRVDGPVGVGARRAADGLLPPRSTCTSRCRTTRAGSWRFYEVPEIVELAAPVYVKLGLRNAPNIYPSGCTSRSSR